MWRDFVVTMTNILVQPISTESTSVILPLPSYLSQMERLKNQQKQGDSSRARKPSSLMQR
jgi:hypothetical protein